MKIIKLLIAVLILFSSSELVAQNNSKIFDTTKVFIYEALFIEKNGDTLTKEKLVLKGSDKPWVYQKKQTELEMLYEPDFKGLESFIHPNKAWQDRRVKNTLKSKTKKSWANYTWTNKKEITGKIENDSVIWFHPPRTNQYVYTYLTAYPEVQLSQLKIGGNWKSKVIILRGYPSNEEFVGSVESDFKVGGLVSDSIDGRSISDCWKIVSTDTHSKLGESKSTFIFDEKYYGFIRMEFEYYNGIKIIFRLKEIITK